jgi:hypothetical protein
MKWKIILLCTALAVMIGGGIFMNAGFAANYYAPNFTSQGAPEACVCSAPSDLAVLANRTNRRNASSLKSNLEPSFQLSLWNCQCGALSCAVTAQAVSCRK